jgi:hypothetical protein
MDLSIHFAVGGNNNSSIRLLGFAWNYPHPILDAYKYGW